SLKNLHNNGNYLLQLVNELLDFRAIDQGGIKLKVAEGNFVSFCKEIYLSFLNRSETQTISYSFVSESTNIELWYDRDQLEKVFFNLLSNAFKNTPAGGKISLTLKETSEEVLAIVEDTGHGISKSNLIEVFKRFYQKDNDPTLGEHGYGIGLSIVQEITQLHHGAISVESEETKGSKFTLRLRKGREHFTEQDLIQRFQSSEALSGYQTDSHILNVTESVNSNDSQILIVEDNPDIRGFLVNILSESYSLLEATNGDDAYAMVKEQLPDLIISDVMMPGMDGISLTRTLKTNPITSHIPIILLTARTSTVFKKEGFETGADDYITKPFSASLLITRINNILLSRENLKQHIRNEIAVRPNDLNLGSPDEKFLKDLTKVIEKNLDNSELNAELVSTEMGMSHSVVYKKLKALTGLNLVEFVRDYRLQQAGQMLQKFGFSVAEACYKVGFSDKKYFSQIFKKKFGITPSEYGKSVNQ
ncbi:MAG: response regulator, partial [Ekhidna sp.]|nr:response regulator [Ekhidna sp.]